MTNYYWRDITNIERLERISADIKERIKQSERQLKLMDRYEDSPLAREKRCDNTKVYVTIKEYLLRKQRYRKSVEAYIIELNKINYTIEVLKVTKTA